MEVWLCQVLPLANGNSLSQCPEHLSTENTELPCSFQLLHQSTKRGCDVFSVTVPLPMAISLSFFLEIFCNEFFVHMHEYFLGELGNEKWDCRSTGWAPLK